MALALAAALALPARAEEPVLLDRVTVEASPLDVYLPARTDIPRQELVGSHKLELSDVLDLAPGINVRQGGRGEPRLDMRGLDQRAVLFTLNGIPVYEPWNGIVNLDLFPVEMLGGVELARGPSSSLFGPNGLAGTVKMSTLLPERPFTGSLQAQWRPTDTWDLRGGVGASQGAFSALVGGRFYTSPGFPVSGDFQDRPATRRRFEDGGERLNSDREEKSVFADLGWRLPAEGRLHATLLGSRDEFGIPPGTAEFAPTFRRNDRQEFDHVQVGLDQPLGEGLGLGAAVYYSRYLTQEGIFDGPDFETRLLTSKADSDELGSVLRLSADLNDRDNLSFAAQVRRGSAEVSDSASGTLSQPHFTTVSLGAENVFHLTPRVRLVAGLSYDLQTGGGTGAIWELNPQGGISVDFGRYGTSRVAVARKIRFPTLRELFDPLEGNPDLQAEKALTYEIGHRVQTERYYVDASLFRMEVEDLIEKESVGDLSIATNLQEALIQGFEIAVGGLPVAWLRLDLNYTFVDAQARNSGSGEFSDIQHKPPHRFNGILQLFLPWELVLRLEGIYTSEQTDRFATDVPVDGFTLFNVQLIKRLGEHLDLFAGADNVLDEDWEEKLGFPGPGRWEFVGLRARY
jgi:vitamin B12 transporter